MALSITIVSLPKHKEIIFTRIVITPIDAIMTTFNDAFLILNG